MAITCDPATLVKAAKCFPCIPGPSRRQVKTYLLCKLAVAGLGLNLIPSGATYAGGGTYTLNVLTNTTYDITWGVNDTSVNICGTVYTSPGAGANTVVYTASCTTMVFTGTGGSIVTARVVLSPGRMPIPTGFAFKISTSGANAVASWNTPPIQATTTQVWTSTDNINFTLAATVAAPGTSASFAAPAAGSYLYCKAAWCGLLCGQFTAPQGVSGQVANWAARVITNGGAAVSAATLAAVNTFDFALKNGSLTSKIKELSGIALDNLTAFTTPLYKTTGNDPWTNHNFLAGDLGAKGLTNNNVNKYLDSGVIPNTIFGLSVLQAITVYQTAKPNAAPYGSFGGLVGGNNFYLVADNAGNFQSDLGGGAGTHAYDGFVGFNMASSTANGAGGSTWYRGSSTQAFQALFTFNGAASPQGLISPMFASAVNLNGAPTSFTGDTAALFAVTVGMGAADAQAWFNAIQALGTSLGWAV